MSSKWQDFITSLSISDAPSSLAENAIYPLTNQSLLQVFGPESTIFLQGQLSCDVPLLTLNQSGLGSHNTAKGRMRSSFRLALIEENNFLLRVHSSISSQAKGALSRYIVFSKAEVEVAEDWVAIGMHGEKAISLLNNIFSQIPEKEYQQHIEDQVVIICTSEQQKSYEIYLHEDKAIELWPQLSEGLAISSAQQHQLLQHQLGLAFVEAQTFEVYIPQMFNYQATPAISFTKGCYTGQEIVARMHYLGKLKRHMYRYTAEFQNTINAGDAVFISDKEQSIGNIVSAVQTANSEWDLLMVLTDDGVAANALSLESGSFDKLNKIDLPYSIEEETE